MSILFPSLTIVLSLIPAAWGAQHLDEGDLQRIHGDSSAYIAMLEDPERASYQKPDEVIAALELKEGETIADIGAGSGYFAFRFSKSVGDQGRVFAVDINPEMIHHMNRRSRELGINNVTTVLAESNDPMLPNSSVDRIFICDTWHHIGDQENYLRLLKQALKPGGQVIMVDYRKRELPVGPPVHMKIAAGELLQQMEKAGFRLLRKHDFLPYQYFFVFSMD